MFEASPNVTFVNTPAPPRKRSFQFSTRAVFLMLATAGFFLIAILVPPVAAITSMIATMVFSAIGFVVLFTGRGWIRPFSAGFLVPNLISYFVFFEVARHGPEGVPILFMISTVAGTTFGTISASVHGYLQRRNRKVGIPNIPLVRNWFSNE
ncbi:MAG: hypothetical protein AAGA30_21630 [Planctomycetota bacterium]